MRHPALFRETEAKHAAVTVKGHRCGLWMRLLRVLPSFLRACKGQYLDAERSTDLGRINPIMCLLICMSIRSWFRMISTKCRAMSMRYHGVHICKYFYIFVKCVHIQFREHIQLLSYMLHLKPNLHYINVRTCLK